MGISKKKSDGRSRHRHHDDSDEDHRESRHRNHSREREGSHDRERSRSRERDRHTRDRGRDRSRDRDTSRKSRDHDRRREDSSRKDRVQSKRTSRSDDEDEQESSRKNKRVHASTRQLEKDVPAMPASSTSGDAVSLSIEDTNKLRAKLGLKPLEVDTGPKEISSVEGESPSEVTKKEAVHAPPKNIGQLKVAEKLKEKMVTMKETRRITKNLSSLRTLGESDSEGEDNASSWVGKMRQRAQEKEAAEKKARMLEEMDEEFGIGDLVSATIKRSADKKYSSTDLKGLTVQHTTEAFQEGGQIVLTLKDAGVLEEVDDVLVNVNIVDSERTAKNVDNKKGSKYNPYDDEEVDELGEAKRPALLKKYDEEIDGETKRSFTLGTSGDVDTTEERQRMIVKEKLKEKQVSLATGSTQIANEYYTSEEMVQFKKPKKKRKVRKKLKADDLVPLGGHDDSAKDHGSRRDHSSRGRSDDVGMEADQSEQEARISLKDEDDSSVDSALQKTRRLLQRGKGSAQGAAKVASMLQSAPQSMDNEETSGNVPEDVIVLNTTAEFCRQVGEEEKNAPRRISTEQEDEFGIEDLIEMDTNPQFDSSEGGWSEVKMEVEEKLEPKADDLYQEAEPMASTSVIATLEVAARKGFIPPARKKNKDGSGKSQADTHRDMEYERQKERERERELSKYERDGSFPEKKGYKPNVRIIHIDDAGHELSVKEAFRFMSHKFHGKGSGKKKTEKRMKKFQAEEFLKSSSSVDTPLNTLSMLKKKQKQSQSPYILLKGAGAQSLQAPDIGKRK